MKYSLFLSISIWFFVAMGVQAQQFTQTEFDAYAAEPLSSKYGQVVAVKVVYDLHSERLHFLDSKQFKYHHEYCRFQLKYNVTLREFNDINYSNDSHRRFLLANINYFKALNKYVLEISPADAMLAEQISTLYSEVVKSTFIGDSLRFLLNSARLQQLNIEIPLIDASEIYQNLEYQAISKHENCGVFRIIESLNVEQNTIRSNEIILLNETPLFLPEVGGVLVTEFQTPLSHLSILGQNRKIPIAAYKNALTDSALIGLNGQQVCYSVTNDAFEITKTNKIKTKDIKHKVKRLKYDLTVDSLVAMEYLKRNSYKFVGNKAANFAQLHKLSQKADFKVPEAAFAIPFYFYNKHIEASGAKTLIENLLLEPVEMDNDTLRAKLKAIRKAIKQSAIDTQLIRAINMRVAELDTYSRLRFRSSTNAEDAKGFSGAGLYASKTGIANDSVKTFEKAIKKVWASLWSYEAYTERKYYNINHQNVFMGVLVHRAFPSEAVNGVALTKNIYRPDNYGFVVNAQLGNSNVVQPDSGVVSDQFICYPNKSDNIYKNQVTVDIITLSSLNNSALVMTEEEIQHLANELELVKQYFILRSGTTKDYLDFGLDVEFKLDGTDRQLYLKQVRYYND